MIARGNNTGGLVNGNRNGPSGTNGFLNGNRKGLVNGNGLTNGSGAKRGLRKGLINGNGIVNGNGFVNGQGTSGTNRSATSRGLVNGNGLTNGHGMTNGCLPGASASIGAGAGNGPAAQGNKRQAGSSRKRRANRIIAVAAVSVMAIVLITPVWMMLRPTAPAGMAIDGDFGDWSKAVFYDDQPDSNAPSPDLDIVRYAVARSGDVEFFYLKVAGYILSGKGSAGGVDVVEMFIDSDADAATGYSFGGIGADRRLEISGYDGSVKTGALYTFSSARDRLDWNGYVPSGSVAAAVRGSALEAAAGISELGVVPGKNFRVLFHIKDCSAATGDSSRALVGPAAGALVLTQKAGPAMVLPRGLSKVLSLNAEAIGKDQKITSLTFAGSGNGSEMTSGELALKNGASTLATGKFLGPALTMKFDFDVSTKVVGTLDLMVDIPTSVPQGACLRIGLAGSSSVAVRSGTATVIGAGLVNCYIGAPPPEIVIDGAFADWDRVASRVDPAGDCPNPGVDITDTRAAKDNSTISFLTAVDGSILEGVLAPVARMTRPASSPGIPGGPVSPVEPPVLLAADTVKVYIDTDTNASTGSPLRGLLFGADYVLTVSGRDHKILTAGLFRWSAGSWAIAGPVLAALSGSRMELQTTLGVLGIGKSSSVGVYFETTDWMDRKDTSGAPLVLLDPLQLTSGGKVNQSADGKDWEYKTRISTDTFVDFFVDSSGYVYAMTDNGTVFVSDGDWTSWTQTIEGRTETNFTAFAISGSYSYGLQKGGDVFKTSDGTWVYNSTITLDTDWEDMCANSQGDIIAIRKSTGDTVHYTDDGGGRWMAWGTKNIGDDGNGETNKGIVFGAGWNSTDHIFILQSDGDIRHDTDGTTNTPWFSIGFTNTYSETFVDISYDSANNILWTVTDAGHVYTFTVNTTEFAPNGTWDTGLGSTYQTGVVAIAVMEIPEFSDAILPVAGTFVLFVIFRGRTRKDCTRSKRRDKQVY